MYVYVYISKLEPPCFLPLSPPGWRGIVVTVRAGGRLGGQLLIGIFKSSYDNVLRWMPQYLTSDKSTLVQVMAWCCQATSHYLNQCWPRSPMPYGVTGPQFINVPGHPLCSHVEITVSWGVYNMTSYWLSAVLPANQKQCLKLLLC